MATYSLDNIYIISYTDVSKGTISIPKDTVIVDIIDIVLIGKSTLDYGQRLDENVLHLMENFACDAISPTDPTPDITVASPPALRQPTSGQFWYNKTAKRLYVYDSSSSPVWTPVKYRNEIASSSGIIAHGQQIPLPAGISSYDECSMFVSPQYVDQRARFILCDVDDNGVVTMVYISIESGGTNAGLANYVIFGNRGIPAIPHHKQITVTPTPSVPVNSPTPTPTVSPTGTPAPGSTLTPTPTITGTPIITPTRTLSPTPTLTRSVTPVPTNTPTVTPVLYTSFILSAAFSQSVFESVTTDSYGYYSSALAGGAPPDFGFMTPFSYNIYPIASLYTTVTPVLGPTINLVVTMSNNPPANTFNRIRFTDKDGIPRELFTSASSTSMIGSTRSWIWAVPSTLFAADNQYAILID